MASIFTYDPDPPRVASPWLRDLTTNPESSSDSQEVLENFNSDARSLSRQGPAEKSSKVTHLQAEPQEGPVEYKLHLLLRPRRKFTFVSTGRHVSGSKHSHFGNDEGDPTISESVIERGLSPETVTSSSASTQQTRQHRLEQLTTQLLWRLQQSSPHHSSSATNNILPSLPEALPELQPPQTPAKLLHGLEESRGALYEIGVSDDGMLVGLAEDEMQESLNNLRAMAACLGCTVEVIREEIVGDCEWLDEASSAKERQIRRTGKLLVAEALIKPFLESKSPMSSTAVEPQGDRVSSGTGEPNARPSPSTEQLRITLVGPTMSGKSTLLGTLTTSTLDNGRGKSRISMLKHRHEISTGVTSSVTQELLGYADESDGTAQVINYGTENIASWIDIHVAARGSRLVFISDSAGHPRYRRTTVRSLVGWAPHWTLLCVPADDTDMIGGDVGSSYQTHQNASSTVSDLELSAAQLDLCLKLRLPLVVVITKLDVASRAGLKGSLTKVLDAIKGAGRKPAMLANTTADTLEPDLQTVASSTIDAAYDVALPLLNDMFESVPIILTSAVQGTGISNLHALLHEIPAPDSFLEPLQKSGVVFHIEDVYSKPAEAEGVIVSGRLRTGLISVGDTGTVGPFSVHDIEDSEDSDERPARKPQRPLPTSRSFPGALRAMHSGPPHLQLPNQEWRRFRVASVRNLRLPVHALLADQVGTVAIVPDDGQRKSESTDGFRAIRKGMVLTSIQPRAARTFVAEFKREDLQSLAVGNHVVTYIASVRASARVVSARAPDSPGVAREEARRESNGYDTFEFDDMKSLKMAADEDDERCETVAGKITAPNLLVTFSFDAGKEFVLIGDQVLVMPGGGPGLYGGLERGEKGLAGLEGFVGKVMEIH